MDTKLPESTRLAFIGCGVMAESMIAGLLRQEIVAARQILASHPRADRREELESKYGIECFEHNADAVQGLPDDGVVLLCVKPQRLAGVLKELAGVVKPTQFVVSIVAGARTPVGTELASSFMGGGGKTGFLDGRAGSLDDAEEHRSRDRGVPDEQEHGEDALEQLRIVWHAPKLRLLPGIVKY